MYDAVGNRIDAANVYNAGNQLLEDANFIYSYDKNGNTISKRDKVSGKYTHYYWNAENKLVRVQEYTNIASTNPVAVNHYIYDGYGRRVAKNVNGTISKYVYDQEAILLETDKDDNTIARYTHGPGIDEPLVMDRGGQSYYYVVDGLGSIVKVIGASGNVVNAYAYDAFGNMVEKTAGVPNMFTYTGREYDTELGLYYYRARYYDAKIGRFLNEDPIWFLDDMNPYTYVQNNPVNFYDPFGLYRMRICLNSSKLQLFDDSEAELFNADIVYGCKDTPTPTGNFTLGNWEKNKVSRRWGNLSREPWSRYWYGRNVFGPYFVPVIGGNGIGIHGQIGPNWPLIFEAAKKFSCSHGCIRLSNKNIIKLHELLPNPLGTQVQIILNCQ